MAVFLFPSFIFPTSVTVALFKTPIFYILLLKFLICIDDEKITKFFSAIKWKSRSKIWHINNYVVPKVSSLQPMHLIVIKLLWAVRCSFRTKEKNPNEVVFVYHSQILRHSASVVSFSYLTSDNWILCIPLLHNHPY